MTGSKTPQSQTVSDYVNAEPEEDDADSTYVPDEKTLHDVEETEADGAESEGDYVDAAESTALALFLTFFGGLGELASAALGAEVAGPQE